MKLLLLARMKLLLVSRCVFLFFSFPPLLPLCALSHRARARNEPHSLLFLFNQQILDQLASGTAPIDPSYSGPRLDSKDQPTAQFVDDLVEWFKKGQVIPRRIAWQIVLGAYGVLKEEESVVDAIVPEGETINVYVS